MLDIALTNCGSEAFGRLVGETLLHILGLRRLSDPLRR